MLSSRCLLFLPLLMHAQGQSCGEGPKAQLSAEDYNDGCWGGGCCNSTVYTRANLSWVLGARGRRGTESQLIALLGSPGGLAPTLTSLPQSADHLLNAAPHPVLGQTPRALFVKLDVFSIWGINQKSQNFMMKYQLTTFWRDCRLVYGCRNALFIQDTSAAFEQFYRPTYFISEQEDVESDMTTRLHIIQGTGKDFYQEVHVAKFRCKMKFEDLPFDEQTCSLTIGLPQHASLVDLHWRSISHSQKLGTAEWDIAEPSSWTQGTSPMKQDFSAFHGLSFPYQGLKTEFKLKRNPKYSIKQFVAPIALFYVLTYAGSYIDPNVAPARVAAHVIPMLILSNKQSSLASSLPPIAYETKLDAWLQMNLVLLTLHLVDYVMLHAVSRLAKKLAALSQKRKEQDPEGGAGGIAVAMPAWERLARKVVPPITSHGDLFLKIVSPLIYICASLAILQ